MKRFVSFLLTAVMMTAMMSVAFVSVSAVTTSTDTSANSINSKSAVVDELLVYGDNITDLWNYTSNSNSDFITVTFGDVINTGIDQVRIFVLNMNNKIVGQYSAETLSGTTLCVRGNEVTVKAVSNTTSTTVPCELNVSKVSDCKFGVLSIDDDKSVVTISEVQKYLVNQVTLTDEQKKIADMDGNNKITIEDVTKLQRSCDNAVSSY